MNSKTFQDKARHYVKHLCRDIDERCIGSAGNRKATGFFAETVKTFGFEVETPRFKCFNWIDNGSELVVGHEPLTVFSGPYSEGCCIRAPLSGSSTVEELAKVEAEGRIVLLYGPIAKEQLMPKNFVFYNPEEHQRIIKLLETRGFLAVLSATSCNPEMSGGLSPFPLIEDGDFILPSAYMTAEEGEKLLNYYIGRDILLRVRAERHPSHGYNVIARKEKRADDKIVLMAHIDSKKGSPGAIDNATGIAILLLVAEMLKNCNPETEIEIVAVNGEDYYSNPGEMLYLEENRGRFSRIMLGINIDGVGYYRGKTAFSLYSCPDHIATLVRSNFKPANGFIEGEPWFQGDHGLFLHNQCPAIAVTSTEMTDLLKIAHTSQDNPEVVDYKKVVATSWALFDFLKFLI